MSEALDSANTIEAGFARLEQALQVNLSLELSLVFFLLYYIFSLVSLSLDSKHLLFTAIGAGRGGWAEEYGVHELSLCSSIDGGARGPRS